MPASSSDQLTVIFDGTCGFCTGIMRRLEQRDRHQRIVWIPCQQLRRSDEQVRLCEQTVVSITTQGIINTGPQAFARILGVLTGSAIPFAVASLPVLCTLLAFGYRGVARVRSHLPGDVPWCEQHPEDCQPDNAVS